MSGGIVFVPTESVHAIEMSVDDLMKIYFSAGMLVSVRKVAFGRILFEFGGVEQQVVIGFGA